MNTLIFDIETNNITDWATLSDLETVHCLSILDVAEGEMTSYNSLNDDIGYALDKLAEAETIVGHNIIGFDVPALRKLYKFKHPNLINTLTLAR